MIHANPLKEDSIMSIKLDEIIVIIGVLFFIFLIVIPISISADEIDSSKPTNFYSFIDNTLEYSSQPDQNVYGYRGNLTLAPSNAHLILAEIPLLYNDRTDKFGIGDIRARYFWLPYKNYDKLFGAFGPSIDIFAPTGKYEDGLGSSSWIVSPGITTGFMTADWIQFFPILSYQYVAKPSTDAIPDNAKKESHGITFQVITPIVFNEAFFMQVTPILSKNDFDDDRKDRFALELFASYTIKPKLQATAYYRGNFEDEVHTVRLGVTTFF